MGASRWPKSIGEAEKIGLVDRVQHLNDGALDDLVFQRGFPQRPLPPVRLGDVGSTNRFCSIRSTLEPLGEFAQIRLKILSVVLPGLAVHPRSRIALDGAIGREQPIDVVDMVQERSEPLLPIPSCCFAYPLERAWRVAPTLRPERVTLGRVLLGQPPSLHRLRSRCSGFVRRLLRYYGAVRLPTSVHHRRSSLDFPMRSACAAADERGTSRFPRKVFPHMLGVCYRARSRSVLPKRRLRCCLPLISTASAPRRARCICSGALLTRLNTRPARTPVNASPAPLRTLTHDSEPMWVASPSPYDSCIHNTLPV